MTLGIHCLSKWNVKCDFKCFRPMTSILGSYACDAESVTFLPLCYISHTKEYISSLPVLRPWNLKLKASWTFTLQAGQYLSILLYFSVAIYGVPLQLEKSLTIIQKTMFTNFLSYIFCCSDKIHLCLFILQSHLYIKIELM